MKLLNIIKKGEYFDSISIMLIAKQISEIEGIADSAVVMGTSENKSLLASSGLLAKEGEAAGDMDLLAALKFEERTDEQRLLHQMNNLFKSVKKSEENTTLAPQSIESAITILPGANLALISVAGKYAGDVAMDSLQRGLHVMLFSDNVPLEKELELKTYARERNLFVMGPDCGTAIINGVPLAFANVVNRGNIGIVAASGTGLQEVTCLISNSGCGISQAIGTGGWDVKKDVGGIMFLEGMKALAQDEQTEVILLVSKPPASEVVEKVISLAKNIQKPLVGVFLGAKAELLAGSNIHPAMTLEEAGMFAVTFSKKGNTSDCSTMLNRREGDLKNKSMEESKKFSNGQKYLRALFSGGTFCDEAQLIAQSSLKEVYSNIPFGTSKKLKSSWVSEKHTIIDLGDDEFTVGKPHPMIDYSTRNRRILAEAENPETAVILLDIVLGYGSNMNPLAELLPVITEVKAISTKHNRFIPIICSVTGTEKDPQNRTVVVAGLESQGVHVMESNAAACKAAIYLVSNLKA